jgi:drug/metabolite transporter (DMT)-like permease
MALSRTNIASSLTLEQSTTIFVFILSAIFLKERITVLKLLSVVSCIVGVVLVAIGDQLQSDQTSSFFSNE